MYEWIEKTFNMGAGFTQAIAVVLALAVVLLLFGLFIFILKRLMGAGAPQARNRQPRVAVMDSAAVDARRRLLLIRRDNIEHLILIGGPTDVVVEQHIVRNAPLAASARAGAYPAAGGHALAPSMKPPTAPGPDIPPRPDDLLPDDEPVSAAPPAPSAPVAPAPAAAPSPSQSPTQAPALTAAPVAARQEPASQVAQHRQEPVAGAPARAVQAPVAPPPLRAARPAASPPEQRPVMSHSNSRAEDLLRAATQNGFNRAGTRGIRPEPGAQEPAEAHGAADPQPAPPLRAAPEVKADPMAAPSVALADPVQKDVIAAAKPALAQGSLARPFSPRERPNYGSHSITPPASGPAARAKTALLKPVETSDATARFEPVIAGSDDIPVNPAGTAPSVSAGVNEEPDVEAGSAPSAHLSSSGQEAAEAGTTGKPSSEDRDAPQTSAKEAVASTAQTEKFEDIPEAPGKTAAGSTQEGTQSVTDAAEEKTAAGQTDLADVALDLEDLLADENSETRAPGTGEPAETGDHADTQDENRTEESEAEESGEAPETPAAPRAPAIAATPASTVSRAPEIRAEPRPAAPSGQTSSGRTGQGLGDRNPIEEEMAKILDEMGGRQS